jgi:hypothetical protein
MNRDLVWPIERQRKLRELYETGKSDREIAAILGTTKNAVIGKRQRMGMQGPPLGPRTIELRKRDARIWDDGTKATLKTMWERGDSVSAISAAISRTEKTIYYAVARDGLAKRPQYRPPSKPRLFPALAVLPQRDLPPAPVCGGVLLEHRIGCCFPVGDTRPHRFCDDPGSIYGQSIYCDHHRHIMINPAYHSQGVRRAGRTDQNHAQ